IKVSLVNAHPITGRTHQLRVHFKAIGHPIIGDKLYGEKQTDQVAKLIDLNRQFLHASEITVDNQTFTSKLSPDLEKALTSLTCV
ncbi:23S rRNA pseudouridine(955/2504/2580) synthase, partial [Candidatus Berkelbacteria bacterium]|nr:23S rRNA pseudouridine(955/2504/2580) synthase [Candidatus Berkelbacteria bacterium]